MKKGIKRFGGVFLALVMMLNCVLPAAADEAGTQATSIKLTGEGIQFGDPNGKSFLADLSEPYYKPTFGYSISKEENGAVTITPESNTNKFSFSVIRTDGESISPEWKNAFTSADLLGILFQADDSNPNYIKYTVSVWSFFKTNDGSNTLELNFTSEKFHTILLPSGDSSTYAVRSVSGENTVKNDGTYEFNVIVYEGYTNRSPYVRYQSTANAAAKATVLQPKETTDVDAGKQYTYKIQNVTQDYTVLVSLKEPTQVTFPGETDVYSITVDKTEVPYGDELPFAIHVKLDGYKTPAVVVTGCTCEAAEKNSKDGGVGEYNFTLKNFTSTTASVTVNIAKKTYKVEVIETADAGKHYATTAETQENVTYGSSYSFTVTPNEWYDAPQVIYEPKDKAQLDVNGFNYTLRNITDNIKVTITDATKSTRNIYFTPIEGVKYFKKGSEDEIKGLESVPPETPYEFEVKLDSNVNKSNIQVKANSIVQSSSQDGVYTIPAGKDTVIIDVSGVKKNVYKVELKNGEGYTLKANGSPSVSHGDEFSFTLEVSDAYKKSLESGEAKIYYYKTSDGEGEKQYLEGPLQAGGMYSVTVEDNITIGVEGITLTKYTVEYEKDGVGFTHEGNTNNEVSYNGSYQFSVAAKVGYRLRGVSYRVGNDPAEYEAYNSAGGKYNITGITGDITIVVHVELVKYTVHFVNPKDKDQTGTIVYSVKEIVGLPEGYKNEVVKDVDGKIMLNTVSDKAHYTADGWYDGEKNYTELALGHEDKEITLTAKYTPILKDLFSVDMDKAAEWTSSGSGVTLRFGCSWKGALLSEYENEIKVMDCGVFFSKNTEKWDSVTEEMLKWCFQQEQFKSGELLALQKNALYIYNFDEETIQRMNDPINGSFHMNINFTGFPKEEQVYGAVAYVHVKIGEEDWYYFYNNGSMQSYTYKAQ